MWGAAGLAADIREIGRGFVFYCEGVWVKITPFSKAVPATKKNKNETWRELFS